MASTVRDQLRPSTQVGNGVQGPFNNQVKLMKSARPKTGSKVSIPGFAVDKTPQKGILKTNQ